MSHFMSPSLLACALSLITGSSLFAATASERDQQALAAKQLIQSGMRLPAQHQVDEFKAAGYADDGQWIEKVLREAYLLRFLPEMPVAGAAAAATPAGPGPAALPAAEPAKQALDPKLEKELKALTAELDAAVKANALPAFAKTLRGGGGSSVERLVNELGRFINPWLPKPLVEPGPEKRQAASNLAEVLCKTMDEEFKKEMEKIKAHKADEERMWNLDDKLPEYKKIITEASELRIEALAGVYLAIIELREVSLRGKEFGIEAAQTATSAFLKTFLGEHRETISQWDFEWGEFNPFTRGYANVLLGEGVRLAVKDSKDEEVESGLQSVIDFDTRPIKNANEMIEAYKLKLIMWGNLLRWRLELGTARALNKGLGAWNDFLERQKAEPFLRLAGGPAKLSVELGQLYILAARLYHAKDDNASANALLGQIIAQHPANPMAGNAKLWLADFSNGGGGGGSWGNTPLAGDPATAINLAKAFISEAIATVDPLRQRTNLLNAAVALRNAVLALGAVPDKVLIESGPAVYDLYANTLNRLGMVQHAAIVGVEGSRLFANYLEALEKAKKPNPWYKPGTKEWDPAVVNPRGLCINAGIYAERLGKLDKTMQRLSDDATEQLTRISPGDVGWQQKYSQIIASLDDGDFAAALDKAHRFVSEFPAHDLLGYQVVISIRQRWVDKLSTPGNANAEKIKQIQDEGAKENAEIISLLDKEQAKTPPPDAERLKLIASTRNAVQSAQLAGMLVAHKYLEIMDLVVPILLTAPPADERLAAFELKLLCHAAAEYNKEATAGDKAKDAGALQANWKRYSDIYRCAVKLLPKLRNHGVESDLRAGSLYLANVFNAVSNQVVTLVRAGGAPSAIGGFSEEANRAFADLYEPWIDDKTPPANILFCANKLWEVDAKERAARLYLKYQLTINNDNELLSFQKEPKPLLDKYGEPVLVRAEFKKAWDEIVDLSYDPPEWLEAYDKGLPAAQMPPGVHADYFKALAAISAFRAKGLAAQKLVMAPEQYKAIEISLTGLERLLLALANSQLVSKHLAQYYRESGQFEKALPILNELYKFDTRDPDAQIAIIDSTRRKMLEGKATHDELLHARDLAAQVREIYRNSNKLGYWEAEILVMEFSLGLGENKVVNDTLAFMNRNRTDLSRDLIAPRIEGDDKRARRAMNTQAAELAKRFLELYSKTGVTQKAAFRVDEVEASGKTFAIYTDLDAPKFSVHSIKTKDDEDVLVLLPEDAQAPEPAAPPAATAPAAAPPAAAPAPAPAAGAKAK
jgi:hypothetical protein